MARTFDNRRVLGIPVLVMAMLMLNVEAFESGKSYINTYETTFVLIYISCLFNFSCSVYFSLNCDCFCMVP